MLCTDNCSAARGGIAASGAEPVAGVHKLDRAEDFWDVVLGSGYRGTVDALRPEQSEAVRDHILAILSSRAVTTLRTDVVFGAATQPLKS